MEDTVEILKKTSKQFNHIRAKLSQCVVAKEKRTAQISLNIPY